MLRGFHADGDRDLVFIPLGINYDRVLEDRTLLGELEPGTRRPGALRAIGTTLGFVLHQVRLALGSRWKSFGYACVNFGTPISIRDYSAARSLDFRKLAKEERFARVAELARDLMTAVAGLVPVLPVPLVATVLLERPNRPLSESEIKSRAAALAERLEAAGAHVYVPRRDREFAFSAGFEALRLRHLLEERDGLYVAKPGEERLLRYYANSIAHLLG
jgi:glycerol-3-phosphate O-acyltransferase